MEVEVEPEADAEEAADAVVLTGADEIEEISLDEVVEPGDDDDEEDEV